MITNPEIIKNTYKTSEKRVEEYLVFKCHIPLLGYDKKYFYFANTEKLRECLDKMPWGLKLLSLFKERR